MGPLLASAGAAVLSISSQWILRFPRCCVMLGSGKPNLVHIQPYGRQPINHWQFIFPLGMTLIIISSDFMSSNWYMKINQTDGYCDNEPCLSKGLQSIKMNAGRCAHAIVILLTFPRLLLAFPSLMCLLLPFSLQIHLVMSGDWARSPETVLTSVKL